jgi:hypothetical protein
MSSREYVPALQRVVTPWETLVERGHNTYVTVDQTVLDELAASNPELAVPDWRYPPGQHPENDWAFATQVVVSSVINFAFLNRDRERDGEGWSMTDPQTGAILSGSNALHPRILQRFGEAEDVSDRDIEDLIRNEVTFDEFLPGVPLAHSRRLLLTDFADGLKDNYGGSVRNLLEASQDTTGDLRLFNEGNGLVERLTRVREFGHAFLDTSYLGDLVFPFNKRADLAPVLIYGRSLTSKTLPRVADIDQSGAIPDYRLPQAFRAKKVMTYSDELAHTVDTLQPIERDSQAEIEIRAATAYSTAYLLGGINEVRADAGQDPYNMAHVDFWLWKMGRELKKNGDTSVPHYTETTTY